MGCESNSGSLTANFTWNGGDPAPPTIVEQQASAYWLANDCPVSASGSCADGLGNPSLPPANQPVDCYGATSQGTNYSLPSAQGNTLSVTLSGAESSVDATALEEAEGGVGCDVSWTVTTYPLSIDPVGALNDGNGNNNCACLVGQQIKPAIVGLPAGCTLSNYQWSVTGTTFQSWTVSGNQSYTMKVDGPGPLNIANPSWYWVATGNGVSTNVSISCNATVTPPSGQGSPFSVSLSQNVELWTPSWTASGTGGEMLVDTKEPAENGTDYWLHAAPIPGQTGGGMNWVASETSPADAPVKFEEGDIDLVQLITPDDGYEDALHNNYVLSDQGQMGLDTSYPYGWVGSSYPEGNQDYLVYYSNDSPGIDLTSLGAIYGFVTEPFEDYLMFAPVGSTLSQFVPLGNFTWSTDGNASIPSTNNWANYGATNSAGPVNPGAGGEPFTAGDAFPSWTQNSGNGHGFVKVP